MACTRLSEPTPNSTQNKGLPLPYAKCPKICHHKQENLDNMKKPMLNFVKDMRDTDIKVNMENKAHTRKIHDLAKYKMEQWLNQNRQDLEERRDRLYTLLQDEEECYRKELVSQFEGRQANQIEEMRKRVATLRANREATEKKFVEEKLDLCFQSQCEQMRTLLSKRLTKEIVADWGTQIEMKNRLECEAQHEERMWAELSLRDVEEKEKREEAEKQVRREAIQRELIDLKRQVELKQMKKAEEYKIKLRELAIIEEDLRALREERENRIREKEAHFLRNKAHVQDMIETRNYYRDRRIKREEVAAREFLKKSVRELYLEGEDREKKKREMMRAIQLYREYTRKRECLEIEKEDVVQRIIDQVIEEQYKKSMEFRFKEAQQRHELHCSVMAGRAQQVDDKKRQKELDEQEKLRELEQLKEDWRQYIQELEQEKLNKEATKAQYVCDLNGQVRYLRKLKDREEDEKRRQETLCTLEERLFQNRMRNTVKQANLAMSNPYRKCYIGKPVRQCFRQV